MSDSKKTVFVSGASGFIAKHLIKSLLSSRNYKVIGSIRTKEKAEKLHLLFKNDPNLIFSVVSDISNPNAFDESFQKHGVQIDYVLHTASPLFFTVKESCEKEILVPAVNGVKSILHAIQLYGPNVKKIVLTSSSAALAQAKDDATPGLTINEASWNAITWEEAKKNPYYAYYGSKTYGEKYFWEFINKHKSRFAGTAICPSYVWGPQTFEQDIKSTLNSSCQVINEVLHTKPGSIVDNDYCGSCIHIDDVVKAHIKCLEDDNLAYERLFLENGRFTLQSIANQINEDFPNLKGRIAKYIQGIDEEKFKTMATLDNRKTRELLGFQFKSFKECIDDTVSQILKVEGGL
ncbi:related to NADPH-dependent methylglyoxal reductase GRE2 [Saccharomycodes ludwigii]|uniref:Related to NADPH-dependent methylglyoxal reductase GRE2 n=1 Tax=Saccharomycodes ludwigii TaxID=36035 RepID=A0A376BBN0_9ASCO|nr:related to NADPH-dependent methylglyoxal reductase GRE2 [Saccharomycodes ludwigii]